MLSDAFFILGAICLVHMLYSRIWYPVFFSPLARIPTPHWSCSISNIWILLARKYGYEETRLLKAHGDSGNVIRVGPKNVSVNGVDAVHAVYQSSFKKTAWYSAFDNYGLRRHPPMFATLGSKEHALRKRMVSNIYSKSHIHSSKAVHAQISSILVDRLIPLLRQEAASNGPCGTEAQAIIMATTMDVVAAYIFGLANGTNFIQDRSPRDHYLEMHRTFPNRLFWNQELHGFTALCSKLGLRLYPSLADEAHDGMRNLNKTLCRKAWAAYSSTPQELHHPMNEPVVLKTFHRAFDEEAKREDSPFYLASASQRETLIACETMDQMLAGQEATATALIHALWRLSQFPDVQEDLRREVLALDLPMRISDTCESVLPSAKTLDSLPILHSVVMETLRLHSPTFVFLPREAPYPSCTVEGYEIPGGTRIAASSYILHHAEDVYPDASRWDHARWLDGESADEDYKRLTRQFWAFGSGSRMCVASHFALNEMKFVIAGIYANFKTVIVDAGDMGKDDRPALPNDDGLFLQFTPI